MSRRTAYNLCSIWWITGHVCWSYNTSCCFKLSLEIHYPVSIQIERVFECEHICGVVVSERVLVNFGAVDGDDFRWEIQAHDLNCVKHRFNSFPVERTGSGTDNQLVLQRNSKETKSMATS